YLDEVVFPNVIEGTKKAGRDRRDIAMSTTAFVIMGKNEEEIEAAKAPVRQQISFYASTRTYKGVLDAHGWGDTCMRLNEKAAKGEWAGMADEITDDMLEVYAVTGTYDDIAEKLKRKYRGYLDRLAFYIPYRRDRGDAVWRRIVEAFNG